MLALGAALLASFACDAPTGANATADAATEDGACTHESCVVSVASVVASGACPTTLHEAITTCPYAEVATDTCGGLTHARITFVGHANECYYAPATGMLVAARVRSDAGFTRVAGDVPSDTCVPTSVGCDHMSTVDAGT
jgi:hypothetical protein